MMVAGLKTSRRVVMFPNDGHPDLAYQVLNVTGDERDEIIVWNTESVQRNANVSADAQPALQRIELSRDGFAARLEKVGGKR
jgi:hypothetical protein